MTDYEWAQRAVQQMLERVRKMISSWYMTQALEVSTKLGKKQNSGDGNFRED